MPGLLIKVNEAFYSLYYIITRLTAILLTTTDIYGQPKVSSLLTTSTNSILKQQ